MSTIKAITPIPHKYQPGVILDNLAVSNLRVTGGDTIGSLCRMEVDMVLYAKVEVSPGVFGYIQEPESGPKTYLVIDDVYGFIKSRAELGDFEPATVLELLVKVIGDEYHRRNS